MNLPEESRKLYLLDEGEIAEMRGILSLEWEINGSKTLKRKFKFLDFKKSLFFVVEVGRIAEEINHHPDIELSYGKVAITCTTHSVKGLSKNDFLLAERIDAVHATFI